MVVTFQQIEYTVCFQTQSYLSRQGGLGGKLNPFVFWFLYWKMQLYLVDLPNQYAIYCVLGKSKSWRVACDLYRV